ncbi:hypothetical protein AB0F81_32120 [Actinoplanes sp. NPDC024001]|uniref:coiled-coil domain-containing protein n=1 Tax=Actinoplanes sp. NPDC024001 TaxID=3154598 RepID=UPI0033EA5636
MGYRRFLAACLCLLSLAGTVLFAPAPVAADRGDDAARAVRRAEALLESASATARAAARNLAHATAALPAAQHKVATTRGVVAATRVEANTARQRADAARLAYRRIADRYTSAADRVQDARERVDEIAQASYMGSGFARLNVLVSASGPQDLMDRLGLVDQLMDHERAEVRTLVGARREARVAHDRAGAAKRAAEDLERAAVSKPSRDR